MEILVAAAVLIGFYMAWTIGANDAANSMAPAVGARALSVKWAVILCAIFEFSGAVLVGSTVTDTIRKGIIDSQVFANNPQILAYGMACALLASGVWLHAATYLGMPVSTTHSIVGSVAGIGILIAGIDHVYWGTVAQIVLSWVVSPIAGGIIAFVIFKMISEGILAKEHPARSALIGIPVCVFFTFMVVILVTIFKGLKHVSFELSWPLAILASFAGGLVATAVSVIPARKILSDAVDLPLADQLVRVEKIFSVLVVVTACSVAFAHGANDVANAIGPLAAVVEIARTNEIPKNVSVEFWILALGGMGIACGLLTYGYKVIQVVGTKITDMTPSRGVAAAMSASVTVLVCSKLGLPISTTHTLVGAVIGVGLARGITAINRKIVKSIFTSWIVTLPITAGLTMLFYGVASLLGLFK